MKVKIKPRPFQFPLRLPLRVSLQKVDNFIAATPFSGGGAKEVFGMGKATAKELTAVEAAKEAGIRLDVLYPMLRAGRLEARKIDGQWRVSASSLAAHVAKRGSAQSKKCV